jgi:hypothetical protein
MWGAFSHERTGLSFTVATGPRQHSHFRVRVSRDWWPYLSVSDSRLPEPGGPGPRIYIPQEQDGLVVPPGTGFPFRRLLLLAGLWWRYSTTPPHGLTQLNYWSSLCSPRRDHLYRYCVLSHCRGSNVFRELFPSNGCCTVACLHSGYLARDLYVALCYIGGSWESHSEHDEQAPSLEMPTCRM